MKEIYLDNAAATFVDSNVKKAMEGFFDKNYGNPGSFHNAGLNASNAVERARLEIAKTLNCTPEEVIFAGSGTESINLAIKGIFRASKSKGTHIIVSSIEHPAVLETCRYLEKYEGAKVTYLPVDKFGQVSPSVLEKAIQKNTILVSIMYANNEIGTINNISQLSKITKKHKVLFHTDACQAGLLNLNVKKLGVDLLTINGSKVYAPKGIGLLFIHSGVNIQPIIHGGGQEFGLRSGTENVPSVVGFALALNLIQKNRKLESVSLCRLRDKLIKGILASIPDSFLNGHPKERLPNNVNITFLNVEGEALLMHLNEKGIYASSGSACSSEKLEPSHVILALGLPYEAAHGSIRFTLSKRTTTADIDKALKVLPGIVAKLRKISPVHLHKEDL